MHLTLCLVQTGYKHIQHLPDKHQTHKHTHRHASLPILFNKTGSVKIADLI